MLQQREVVGNVEDDMDEVLLKQVGNTIYAVLHLFAPSRLCLPRLNLFLNSFKCGLLFWFTGELLSLTWYFLPDRCVLS